MVDTPIRNNLSHRYALRDSYTKLSNQLNEAEYQMGLNWGLTIGILAVIDSSFSRYKVPYWAIIDDTEYKKRLHAHIDNLRKDADKV